MKILSLRLKERLKEPMSKKYLIVGDFSTRLKFYLEAIKETLSKEKSTIILVPDLAIVPFFTKYLRFRKSLQNEIAILHAGMTKTERWIAWDQIRAGKAKIIIGSQSALFAPVKKLGLIIIDQEENETFKNDRSPRFHAVTVAQELANLTAANLVLGSLTPRVETYFKAVEKDFRILKKVNERPKITIVDMNSEKYVISNPLEKEIESTLKNHQKILLFLNRKGEGTKFSCADCGWIALCQKCGLPLVPQKAENVCYRCEENYLPQAICPKCQGVHLKPMGLGTTRLKKFLVDLFPQAKIIQIEKEIDGQNLRKDWDIAITTAYGMKFNWSDIALVGIIDADQGLNFPDFTSFERTFQTLYKFLRLGDRGMVQTHLVENYLASALAGLAYEKFFLDELTQRKKYGFPPYVHLIRLLFKDVDREKVKEETNRLYKLLITDSSPGITISPPHACFIEKERGKIRWQIVIKAKRQLDEKLKRSLGNLPKGWIVDVDPMNLL